VRWRAASLLHYPVSGSVCCLLMVLLIASPDCVIASARRSSTGVPNHTMAPGQTTHSGRHNPRRTGRSSHPTRSSQTTLLCLSKPHGSALANHTNRSCQTTRFCPGKPHEPVVSNHPAVPSAARSLGAFKEPHIVRHSYSAATTCPGNPLLSKLFGATKQPHSVRHKAPNAPLGTTDRA
jgi:hypothetical protein